MTALVLYTSTTIQIQINWREERIRENFEITVLDLPGHFGVLRIIVELFGEPFLLVLVHPCFGLFQPFSFSIICLHKRGCRVASLAAGLSPVPLMLRSEKI